MLTNLNELETEISFRWNDSHISKIFTNKNNASPKYHLIRDKLNFLKISGFLYCLLKRSIYDKLCLKTYIYIYFRVLDVYINKNF